ncbi:hypothetical protein DFH05DRAFT_1456450 [Lentinula detonsa]|uniref:Uncharacterized protein n=1 Tax=Lentinula detonsa TaxID=2804962 RepID=A0A9W8P763_9AGAR|nr:hypothetical protein DFH05DRAFT_1456450 [Lentinula detonsa]
MHLNSVYFILGLVSAGFAMPFHTSTPHFELARANFEPKLEVTISFKKKCEGKPLRNAPPTGEIFFSSGEAERLAGIPLSVYTRAYTAVQSLVPHEDSSRVLLIGFKNKYNEKTCGAKEAFEVFVYNIAACPKGCWFMISESGAVVPGSIEYLSD